VQRVACNLLLDVNLCFEEELQRAFERAPYFVDSMKKIVGLIHQKLKIRSLAGLYSKDVPLAPAAKAERERYIVAKLAGYFERTVLEKFLQANIWTDRKFGPFLAQRRTDLLPDEEHEALGFAKLLKMMKTQFPYFGGSVEYHEHIENSLEFWMYHLSTVAKDPDRQFPTPHPVLGQLPRPMLDYRTTVGGDLPFLFQRNLGTGIAEALWGELPAELCRYIELKLKEYTQKVATEGDAGHLKNAKKLWDAYDEVGRLLGKDHIKVTIEELWNESDEDTRKAIYGDMCHIPWSDAHLLEGGEGFEHSYSLETSDPDIRSRHPPRQTPGLMNVAGVFGSILENPLTAAWKYMEVGGGDRERKRVRHELDGIPGVPRDTTLMHDFVEKHTRWHRRAIDNHKPIIGGLSGHALAYMNLYAAALELCTEEERDAAPSLETLRGILIGGLTGAKRHHGADEVYAASTSVDASTEATQYNHRATYADVFLSSDRHIADSANKALSETEIRYPKYDKTVLRLIVTSDARAREALETSIAQYIACLGTTDAARVQARKDDVVVAVARCLGEIDEIAEPRFAKYVDVGVQTGTDAVAAVARSPEVISEAAMAIGPFSGTHPRIRDEDAARSESIGDLTRSRRWHRPDLLKGIVPKGLFHSPRAEGNIGSSAPPPEPAGQRAWFDRVRRSFFSTSSKLATRSRLNKPQPVEGTGPTVSRPSAY
jgi:hypothetical protein